MQSGPAPRLQSCKVSATRLCLSGWPQVRDNILRLVSIGSRRGRRHEAGLPVGSQRTHTNANTAAKLRHLVMYDTSKR